MTRNFTSILKTCRVVAIVLGTMISVQAESRVISLPNYLANPGGILQVPLTLDNAAGLAAIQVQINFDAEVLTLQSVSAGSLGQAFEMNQGDGDGFVQLTFFRGDALTTGSGQLAILKFRANQGAVTDLFSELAIADIELSDSTGVIDMHQKDALTITSGEVTVSVQPDIDNGGNGLPDWWEEQYELDPLGNNLLLDIEKDGLPNLLEYAFGGNPKLADAHTRGVQQLGRYEVNGVSFLRAAFHRRVGDNSLTFRVQESTDLADWTNLNLQQRIIGVPQNMGDGTEYVEVMGSLPITGPNAEPKGFLRVAVDKAE